MMDLPLHYADISAAISTKMAHAKILVVGDLILDRFINGDISRVSPESNAPVLHMRDIYDHPGGAYNVVANLCGLGIRPYVTGLVGDDANAQILKDFLAPHVQNLDGFIIDTKRPTIVKTRVMAGDHHLVRIDEESALPIRAQHEEKILEYIHSIIAQLDVIIISDYNKGVFGGVLSQDIIQMARRHNVYVCVDPKGKDYSKYKNAHIITPNVKEMADVLGRSISLDDDADIVAAGQDLTQAHQIDVVLATRSEKGMSLIPSDKNIFGLDQVCHIRFDGQRINAVGVSGAGDTVMAVLAGCLAAGMIMSDAAHIANIAAGIEVQKQGTTVININELMEYLKMSNTNTQSNAGIKGAPIVAADNWQDAKNQVLAWKDQGLRVGFTNGCFDILHAGHVTYLNETHQKCDVLVMGLNCDASVKRLKGETRPINEEQNRAEVLAGLKAIDLVVLFAQKPEEDDKAIDIIKFLEPDVYFKGGDYTEDQVPEAPIVRNYGGEVYICKPVDGLSTTLTVEKIKKADKDDASKAA